jgi:hypothetical protein
MASINHHTQYWHGITYSCYYYYYITHNDSLTADLTVLTLILLIIILLLHLPLCQILLKWIL